MDASSPFSLSSLSSSSSSPLTSVSSGYADIVPYAAHDGDFSDPGSFLWLPLSSSAVSQPAAAADRREPSASSHRSGVSSAQRRRRKAWHEESLGRRTQHAASDARRRANITELQQTLVRLVKARTGRATVSTQQALEEALALLQSDSASLSPPAAAARPPSPALSLPDFSVTGAQPAVPRPLLFSNSHMRQLSTLMGYAIVHYSSGAAFHPCQQHFRSSPALHSILSGGGRCGVLSHDMLVLDCTHDLSLSEPTSELLRRRPNSECALHTSDCPSEPPLSYAQLAELLRPAFSSLDDGFVLGEPQMHSQCLLVAAVYPRAGRMVRSLKLMSLVRHADGREPVLIAVEYIGTFSSLRID